MQFDHYTLRPPLIEDTESLYKLVTNNKPRLLDYFPIALNAITSIANTRSYIELKISQAEKQEAITHFIIDDHTTKVIGVVFIKNFDWTIPKAELAYYIDKNYEGKGIISEALKQLINYSFTELKLNKVYLRTATDNAGSQKVALKNGFKLEGVLRKDYRIFNGTLIDLNYYGLVKE